MRSVNPTITIAFITFAANEIRYDLRIGALTFLIQAIFNAIIDHLLTWYVSRKQVNKLLMMS